MRRVIFNVEKLEIGNVCVCAVRVVMGRLENAAGRRPPVRASRHRPTRLNSCLRPPWTGDVSFVLRRRSAGRSAVARATRRRRKILMEIDTEYDTERNDTRRWGPC